MLKLILSSMKLKALDSGGGCEIVDLRSNERIGKASTPRGRDRWLVLSENPEMSSIKRRIEYA